MTGFLGVVGVVVVVAVLTSSGPAPGHRKPQPVRIESCVKPWPGVAGMVVVKRNPRMGQKERV